MLTETNKSNKSTWNTPPKLAIRCHAPKIVVWYAFSLHQKSGPNSGKQGFNISLFGRVMDMKRHTCQKHLQFYLIKIPEKFPTSQDCTFFQAYIWQSENISVTFSIKLQILINTQSHYMCHDNSKPKLITVGALSTIVLSLGKKLLFQEEPSENSAFLYIHLF